MRVAPTSLGDGMETLSSSGGMRWRRGGRWGTEKVRELIHIASISQASREWSNRPFSGCHPNPPNLACSSVANRPSRYPNKPNLYYISLGVWLGLV